ncbi:helix-turn-helix domain-containing protein [Vibrio penaeicida]|uniref:HTH cro/C1-type domain-containing protein n=1 Tax=Vibrio penaeicida TaxID=104609 RepID=A0AAV5NQV6_9VIBR|nr:helix-turn-helix transcriptional regulator [Vibrio penaeicida]RTZ24286.1 XRE family transcriptional regulator [Vibrio penaeicida]GLQ72888.1 hypothetical protein GCM10007932_22480 [Vibrio penaeicida]
MTELRKLRTDKNMTLESVATSLEIDLSTLSRIERGIQLPNRTTASKLSRYYSISVGDLFNMLTQGSKQVSA